MPIFLCLSGKARGGKDTSASMAVKYLTSKGKRAKIIHYADLLKFICLTYLDWNGEKDEPGRTLLQEVGTDIVRSEEPNYWVDFVISLARFFSDRWDYVLIPDCRFPNEIERIKSKGYPTIHIRVVRPGYVSELTAEQQQHASEVALDSSTPDYTLVNTTLEQLEKNVHTLIDTIEKGGE